MIRKNYSIPIYLEQLETLSSRLNHNHTKWPEIEEWPFRQSAGFAGEKALEYALLILNFQTSPHLLQHTTSPSYHSFFQIDVLLVTSSYDLILDVKNISGASYFDGVHTQLIRQK
ncbi:nuclease-related domain-containing protein [Halobacillus amylolyticus]|uniref:NERD domain-containing protein n=1 Tax=Halobacillus amylolyticus TaxID=2932259 RepID=A0ABY4HIN5_9BACI|nr:nuclease-related domain-containing protein [Halobacillus amylolyticus]UOR13770.1 NERD domain-containing protein [Halobacillus amylolyticus]